MLNAREVDWVPQCFHQSSSILDMPYVVVYSGIEDVLKTVESQKNIRKDSSYLWEVLILILQPEFSQVSYCIDSSLLLSKNAHKGIKTHRGKFSDDSF